MGQILAGHREHGGFARRRGVADDQLPATNALRSIASTFEPGWGGTLSKVNIDPATRLEMLPAAWEVGGGKDCQPDRHAVCAADTDVPRRHAVVHRRKIVTMHTNGTAIPFLFDQPVGAQQDALAPGSRRVGQQVLEYLRGKREQRRHGDANFRVRRIEPEFSATSSTRIAEYVGRAEAAVPGFARSRLLGVRNAPQQTRRRWSTSAPTTACCTRSTMPPAREVGRTSRATCIRTGRHRAWPR